MDKNVILAKKYGRAIYEIAEEKQCLKETEEELRFISETIAENKELGDILNHPLLEKDVKKDTIKKLFADKVQPAVLQFCYVVIDKGRSSALDQKSGGDDQNKACRNYRQQNYHEAKSGCIFDRRIYRTDGRPSDRWICSPSSCCTSCPNDAKRLR